MIHIRHVSECSFNDGCFSSLGVVHTQQFRHYRGQREWSLPEEIVRVSKPKCVLCRHFPPGESSRDDVVVVVVKPWFMCRTD